MPTRLYASAVDDYDLTIPEHAALFQAAETVDALPVLEDSRSLFAFPR